MERQEVIEKLERFATRVRKDFPVKQVIFYGVWLEGLARNDDEIEVAVIFDRLKDDYLEVKDKLTKLAAPIDRRISPDIIETDRKNPVDFYKEVMENGHIVWEAT